MRTSESIVPPSSQATPGNIPSFVDETSSVSTREGQIGGKIFWSRQSTAPDVPTDTILMQNSHGTITTLSQCSSEVYENHTEPSMFQHLQQAVNWTCPSRVDETNHTPIPDDRLAISIQNPNTEGEVMLEVKSPIEYLMTPEPENEGKDVMLFCVRLATIKLGQTDLVAADWDAGLNKRYKSEASDGILKLKEEYRRSARSKVFNAVESWAKTRGIAQSLPFCG